MMTTITTLTVREIENEGRVQDIALGAALGMARPETIRETIKAHREALEAFGVLSVEAIKSSDPLGRGRPGREFWLNEEQALYVTMHLRTPKAQSVKVEIVKVFTASVLTSGAT